MSTGDNMSDCTQSDDWKTVLKLEASPEVSWLKLSYIFFIHVAEHEICLLLAKNGNCKIKCSA